MTYPVKLKWNLLFPLSEATTTDISITKEQLFGQANPFPIVTKIVVMSFDGKPLVVVEKRCQTIGDILTTIEQNMVKPIKVSEQEKYLPELYKYIGSFWDSNLRLRCITKLEQGDLTPTDILDDYDFTGNIYSENGMIWYTYDH